jgi:hypothetical protein
VGQRFQDASARPVAEDVERVHDAERIDVNLYNSRLA